MHKDRISAAIQIMAQPHLYKVCEGCDSILKQSCNICPSCKSYRFDESEPGIIEMAKNLGSKEQKSVTESDLF
jgi:RNA polymerase subunit RPABC4/transcription elongation factor Spt4